MKKNNKKSKVITHVVFDNKTGKVIHTHQRYDVEKEAYCECNPKEILRLIESDDFILKQVSGRDLKNLDVVMTTDMPEQWSSRLSGFLVDTRSKKLIEMPKIELSSDKKELEGDGKDKTTIEIKVVNNKGKVDDSYEGRIKISTNRGKLSARGGVVKLKKGVGQITLISANETVDRVSIMAQCLEGKCLMGDLDLEFV